MLSESVISMRLYQSKGDTKRMTESEPQLVYRAVETSAKVSRLNACMYGRIGSVIGINWDFEVVEGEKFRRAEHDMPRLLAPT